MKEEHILAKIIRWGLYSSAIIPLIIFKEYISPFHFGKVVVFRSVIEVLLAMFLVLVLVDRSYRPKLDWFGWAFLGFTGVYTLTTFTGVSAYYSFWGTLERMGGLFSFWHYFFFYVMLMSVLRERKHWQVLMELFIFTGVISAFYGFLQKTDWTFILGGGGRARPFGTIGNAALFAGYQILIAFLAGTFSFRKDISPGHMWWYRFASGATFLAVLMTAVRGSLIGVVAGVFVFILLWSVFNGSRKARMTLLGVVGSVALFVLFGLLFKNSSLVQNSPYLTRVTDFSPQTYTVQTRLWTWTSGLQGWKESPKTILLGWGPENFNVPFSRYFNPRHFRGPGAETFFDRAHNNFIEVLVTMGILGLGVYLAMFAVLCLFCWRMMQHGGEERLLGMGFIAMIIAYLIHNSFIFDTSANYITFFAFAGFLSYAYGRMDKEPARMTGGAPRMSPVQLIALVILLIASFVTLARYNITPARANHATTRAIVAGWQGQFPEAMDQYRRAVGYDTFGVYDERHRLAQYVLEVNAQVQGLPEPFVEAVNFAISEVEKNTELSPQDYLPLLYLARLHIILGKDDSSSPHNDIAVELTKRALDISPTFVRSYYEIAQGYLNKGEPAQAYEWFAKAQQLNPDVALTYWYMGITRVQAGDLEGGLTHIEDAIRHGYGLSNDDIERLVNIYTQADDYSTVITLLEGLIQEKPDNVQYLVALASAYEFVGRIDDAVAAVKKAMELEPRFRDQGEEFLKKYDVSIPEEPPATE